MCVDRFNWFFIIIAFLPKPSISQILIPLEQIGGTSDIPKKTTLVCNENEKSDDYHYFNAIDKFDPKGKDVCGGDSGGSYPNV